MSDKLWSADAVVPPSGWNNQTRDRGLSELWFCGICIWEGAGSSFACCLLLQGYAIILVSKKGLINLFLSIKYCLIKKTSVKENKIFLIKRQK